MGVVLVSLYDNVFSTPISGVVQLYYTTFCIHSSPSPAGAGVVATVGERGSWQ